MVVGVLRGCLPNSGPDRNKGITGAFQSALDRGGDASATVKLVICAAEKQTQLESRMPSSIDAALNEAGNPETRPERLQQLSEWKRRHERSRLRKAIAANPNVDDDLLLALAADHPKEVISNPRFQLLELSGKTWWKDCEAAAVFKLLVELGENAPAEARTHLIQQIVDMLTEFESLEMNMEWHMSFSKRVTVNWQAVSVDDDDDGDDDDSDATDKKRAKEACQAIPVKQVFSIQFSCVVEENLYFLRPPCEIEDPRALIEELIQDPEGGDLLAILEQHGWEAEGDSTPGDQGFWEIESVDPQLEDWEFDSDLFGDGSGVVAITDPTGKVHNRRIQPPSDYGDEYVNPTLTNGISGLEMIEAVLSLSGDLERLASTLQAALALGD